MKIRRISEFQTEILFPIFQQHYYSYLSAFKQSNLGKIYEAIPWSSLIKSLGIVEHKKGPKSFFSPRGKLALMFLKHYAACSDEKLIEQLNANIYYQIFCDLLIDPGTPLQNSKIVSQIRCELAELLDIDQLQLILANHWKPHCANKNSIVCDATCYESYIRYPTDVKLLYESVVWNYKQLKLLSSYSSQKVPRTKMSKWKRRYGLYAKSRRPSKKATRSITRGLLKLLRKIDQCLDQLPVKKTYKLAPKFWQRRSTTKQIIDQQWIKFYEGKDPQGRIVSLDKPYIRPIKRGKEIKKTEFGAKVHKVQIDGISFIEHLSFDAFNEGIRLKSSIYLAQNLMKTKVQIIGADGIYANNPNRNYVTKHKIKTDFKRKGPPSKHKKHFNQLSKMITKQRASALEGSFGTDKEHFLLNRIKARSELTERLWIFFGIHTSNALKIGKRMAKSLTKAA